MDHNSNLPKPFVFPVMKKTIEDLFTKTSITKSDVEMFQGKYWEQLVPNFSQALKLLDIHGVPRHNIFINDRLLDAIKTRIETKSDDCDNKKRQKLWQRLIKTGVVYIHHPYMRSLIMQVLGKMNSIKERHVNLIVDNTYLYADAPLPVLRHIWVAHPHKFQEELDKVIATFQNNWTTSIMDALCMSIMSTASTTADLVPILYWPPRRRRRDPSIVRIVEMIGEGEILYDKTLTILREECTRFESAAAVQMDVNKNQSNFSEQNQPEVPPKRRKLNAAKEKPVEPKLVSYIPSAFMPNQPSVSSTTLCTLRFDLLMSLNEAKVDTLCVPDRIHRFVWCLDACVRNRRIDQRHASELAYHLHLQRRRWARQNEQQQQQQDSNTESSETGADLDSTSKTAPSTTAASDFSTRRSKAKYAKSTSPCSTKSAKRNNSESESGLTDTASKEMNILERDMHMACKDPWVVYTICTSLIRYVLNGLYEDKLPRDVPEVNLLVKLLVLGLGDELGSSSSAPAPDKALISDILPAIAQLQVLTWRAQVADEIMFQTSKLWPSKENSSLSSTSTGTGNSSISSSSSGSTITNISNTNTGHGSAASVAVSSPSVSLIDSNEQTATIPPNWKKRIDDATQSTNISVPPGYLSHPIGYLLLQYHALFALERNELAVLRALLKAAGTVAQSKSNKVQKPNSSQCLVIFRWRPEVLQALVLGIARLPVSAPAFVNISRSSTIVAGGSTESVLGDQTEPADSSGSATNSSASLTRNSSLLSGMLNINEHASGLTSLTGVKSTVSTGPMSINQTADSHSIGSGTNTNMITRATLAGLLRASLPLVNDIQLLALAQIALLVPGPVNSGSSNSSNTSATNPTGSNADGGGLLNEPTSPNNALSERERLINTLSRHCSQSNQSSTGESAVLCDSNSNSTSSSSSSYKSSNSRILAALDVLRKDVEKSFNTLASPLTSTNLVGMKSSTTGGPLNNIPFGSHSQLANLSASVTPLIGNNMSHTSDVWSSGSTNPQLYSNKLNSDHNSVANSNIANSRNSSLPYYGSLSNRFMDSKSYPNSQYHSMGFNYSIGTPLTNPGLMAATPNINAGHSFNVISTPRRPPTPPYEFKPPSPPTLPPPLLPSSSQMTTQPSYSFKSTGYAPSTSESSS